MASTLARQALNVLRLSTSSRSASLIQRRGLAGASDLHGPKKVDFCKDPKTPSLSKEEQELIFINVDTSKWISRLGRCFQLQVKCVQAYCEDKLKSNPMNAIGINTLGATQPCNRLEPTSDLNEIMGFDSLRGGELDIIQGLKSCLIKLDHYSNNNNKRIIFFIGGPTNMEIELAESYGEMLKKDGIALDIVNFFLDERFVFWKMGLDAFVAAANNNNNSHITHVQADSRTQVHHVLSSMDKGKEFKLKNEDNAHKAYLKYGLWSVNMNL